jgi:hypothetical protein
MSGAWRHDLIPVLSLIGVAFDALGGLYLAYDLLGGKHGPLRRITKTSQPPIRQALFQAAQYLFPLVGLSWT